MKWRAHYENQLFQASLKTMALLILCAYCILALLQSSIDPYLPLPLLGLAPAIFFLNLLLVLAPLLAWSYVIDGRALGVISLAGAAIFARLNHHKMVELGQPIEPLDFYNFHLSPLLMSYLSRRELSTLIVLLLVPFGYRFFAHRFWNKRRKQAKPHRIYLFTTVSVTLIFLVVCLEPLRSESLLLQLFPPHPDHADAAGRQGLPLTEIVNLKFVHVFHPNNYSEQVVRSLVSLDPVVALDSMKRHDVILILLESFRDYAVDGVKFNEDPIPFYHKLKAQALVGRFYSPLVGGGTANVEYEVLTGMPVAFLPRDSIAYEQYVDHAIPTVPAWLKKAGYEMFAIHNHFGTFFNRRKVYAQFKFDDFFDVVDLMHEYRPLSDLKMPDHFVFEKSLQLLRRPRTDPQFQLLITLNTHGPYDNLLPKHQWVSSSTYPDEELTRELNVYSDRMHALDNELEQYFSELKKMKNPPTVVMFGDHHPSVSILLPFPDSGGRHQVEGVVWNDKSGQKLGTNGQEMTCLSTVVLRVAGVPLTPFFEYVERYCHSHDQTGPMRLSESNIHDLAGYEILSYDRLFGEKYSTPTSLKRAPSSAVAPNPVP